MSTPFFLYPEKNLHALIPACSVESQKALSFELVIVSAALTNITAISVRHAHSVILIIILVFHFPMCITVCFQMHEQRNLLPVLC